MEKIADFQQIFEENLQISEKFFNFLKENEFFSAPASTKFHGNYAGGLFEHSVNVMNILVDFTEKGLIHWERPESPYIVGMFHDICKCDEYTFDRVSEGYVKNQNTLLKGHGDKSVMILSQFMTLTEEEILCIRYHMGAYETDSWNQYDKAIRKYENVLWTHHADMIASKVVEL